MKENATHLQNFIAFIQFLFFYYIVMRGGIAQNCPSASILRNPNTPICNPEEISTLNVRFTPDNPDISATTFNWQGPNNFNQTYVGGTQLVLNLGSAHAFGVYTLTVQIPNCPPQTQTINLSDANVIPPLSVTSNGQICKGQTQAFTGTQVTGASYRWYFPGFGGSGVQGVYLIQGPGPNSSNPINSHIFSIPNQQPANAGVYRFEVIKGNCVKFKQFTVQVRDPGTISAGIIGSNTVCEGANVQFNAGSTEPGASFFWSGPCNLTDPTNSAPSLLNVTTACSGIYTLSGLVNGCPASAATVILNVKPSPAFNTLTADAGSLTANSPNYYTLNLCAGGNANVTPSPTDNVTTSYSWLKDGQPYPFSAGPTLQLFGINTTQTPGLYSLILDRAGCRKSIALQALVTQSNVRPVDANAYVTAPSRPPSKNIQVCQGENVNFTAQPVQDPFHYLWQGPGNYQNSSREFTLFNITTSQAGQYTYRVINGACTSNVVSVNVTVNTPPNVSVTYRPSCVGDTVNLSAAFIPGLNYTWQDPNNIRVGSSASITRPPSAFPTPGIYNYSLKVTDGMGCIQNQTVAVNITPRPAPPLIIGPQEICEGAQLNLLGVSNQSNNFIWEYPGSSGAATGTGPNLSLVATPQNTGLYRLRVFENTCTSAVATHTVTIRSQPKVSLTQYFCEGGSQATLKAPIFTDATYNWSGPGGFSSTLSQPTLSNPAPGQYTLTLTQAGRPFGYNVNLSQVAPETPVVNFNGSSLCENNDIQLKIENLSAYPEGIEILWQGPNGFSSTESSPWLRNATLAMAGEYTVSVNIAGCTKTSTKNLILLPTPQIQNLTDRTECAGANFLLAPSITPSGSYTYQWSKNGASLALTTPTLAFTNASIDQGGLYTFSVISASGCAAVKNFRLNILPQPVAQISSVRAFCVGSTLTLDATPQPPPFQYAWAGPNGFTATRSAVIIPNVTNAAQGVYTLVVYNGNCSAQTTANITILASPVAIAGNNSSSASPLCLGAQLQLNANGSASGPNISYLWQGPAGYSSTSRNPAPFTPVLAQSGVYTLTVTNSVTGCSGVATTPVYIHYTPYPEFAHANFNYCVGQALRLEVAPQPETQYYWTGPGGITGSSSALNIPSVTSAHAGNYLVFAVSKGCTSLASVAPVGVRPLPPPPTAANGFSQNPVVCLTPERPVQNIGLYAQSSQGSDFIWSGPGGFSHIGPGTSEVLASATYDNNNQYSVSVIVNGCTSAPAIFKPTVYDFTRARLVSNAPLCQNSPLTLGLEGVSPYPNLAVSWSEPTGRTQIGYGPVVYPAPANGIYNANIQILGGCSYRVSAYIETIPTPLYPSIAVFLHSDFTPQDVFCQGQSAVFRAATNFLDNPPATVYFLRGIDPQNNFVQLSSSNNYPDIAIYNLQPHHTGFYEIFAVNQGCTSAIARKNIIVHPKPSLPQASVTSPICSGGQATFRITNPDPSVIYYNWSGPTFTANQYQSSSYWQGAQRTFTGIELGGTFSVTALNAMGCSSETTFVNLTVNPSPAPVRININGGNQICSGSGVSFYATPHNTDPAIKYLWSGPGGFSSTMINPFIPNVTATQGGAYSLIAYIGNCTSQTATATLTVLPTPVVEDILISPAPGPNGKYACGQYLTFSAQVGGIQQNNLFYWSTNWGRVNGPQFSRTVTAGDTDYALSLENANGCKSNVFTKRISVECASSKLSSKAASSAFSLYPNPTKGNFSLSYQATQATLLRAKLTDALGRLILEEELNAQEGFNEFQFEMPAGAPSGVYYMRVFEGRQERCFKLIVH